VGTFLRDVKIGLIGGLIGLFLIVLPLLTLFYRIPDKEEKQDIVVYVREI